MGIGSLHDGEGEADIRLSGARAPKARASYYRESLTQNGRDADIESQNPGRRQACQTSEIKRSNGEEELNID